MGRGHGSRGHHVGLARMVNPVPWVRAMVGVRLLIWAVLAAGAWPVLGMCIIAFPARPVKSFELPEPGFIKF